MKKILSLVVFSSILSCSMFTKKDVKSALDVAQIMCVLGSDLVDKLEIKKACNLVGDIDEALDQMLVTKAMAKKASKCSQ